MVEKVFDAVYENGVLRPLSPLPLAEGEKVRFSLEGQEPISHSDEVLLQQLAEAVEGADPRIPGPIEAYETAAQLQKFLEQAQEEGI